MMQKKAWRIAALLIAFIVVGTGCFFLGRSTVPSDYAAERDLNIRINRSELEGLGKIDGTIYVTGHKSPDADTVGSSFAYAALLRQLGYDAQPVVLGQINNETKYILGAAGLDAPKVMDDATGRYMVLVDHSEYTQSAEGLQNAYILSIIDHHGDGAITTGNQLIYDSRPLGSTATIIWIRYRNYGLTPDPQTALVMMGAILSDTMNLRSDTTTEADREALRALSQIAGVSDTDAFYLEMYKASISYEGMTDEEIFYSDYKEYESNGWHYSIGCINAYSETNAEEMAARMNALLPSTLAATGMDMAFAQINIFYGDVDITYIVPSDHVANKVIQAAFGGIATFDGTSYVMIPGISRRQTLVPAITDILAVLPRE